MKGLWENYGECSSCSSGTRKMVISGHVGKREKGDRKPISSTDDSLQFTRRFLHKCFRKTWSISLWHERFHGGQNVLSPEIENLHAGIFQYFDISSVFGKRF